MKHKVLKNNNGFTLVETLMAVLLVSLMTAAITAGVVAARNAHREVTLKANGEVVETTMITAINYYLSNAELITVSGTDNEKTVVSWMDSRTGAEIRIVNSTVNGSRTIVVRRVNKQGSDDGEPVLLVSDKMAEGYDIRLVASETDNSDGNISFIGEPESGYFVYTIEVSSKRKGDKVATQRILARPLNQSEK